MRKDFVFAGQGGSRDLRQHETGVETGIGGEKWRQAFVECGIYQPLDSSLGDARECSQSDGQVIQGKGQRVTMKIPGGDHDAFAIGTGKYERIVYGGIHFYAEGLAAKRESIAYCAVYLGNAAQGIGVLDAATFLV